MNRISPKIQEYARHKFASRIVQACFEYMNEPYKIELLRELSSKNDFIISLNDPNIFFVYLKIIQTMAQLDTNEDIGAIINQLNINVLKMYTDEKFSKITAQAIECFSLPAVQPCID